jgi:hypothetical protein
MQNEWFNLTLGFNGDSGADGDTVIATLGRLCGWTVRVTGVDVLVDPVNVVTMDVIVAGFEQVEDGSLDYPMFLVGWAYDETRQEHDFKGAPVRIPLAGAKITVY